MLTHLRSVIIICAILVSTTTWAVAEDLYVCDSNGGTSNGLSWSTCFDGFSDISWGVGAGSVGPGDTLYVGTGTYNEGLTIGATGTIGNVITISAAQDTQTGVATITNSGGICIYANDKSYITITGNYDGSKNIKAYNGSSHGLSFQGTSDNIIVEYVEIDSCGDGSPESGMYFYFDSLPDSMEISNCYIHDSYQDGMAFVGALAASSFGHIKIHDCTITNVHDDGIEAWHGGIDFYDNILGDRILPHRGHPDGMQMYSNYLRIYNNTFRNWYISSVGAEAGLPLVYLSSGGGLCQSVDENDCWMHPEYIYIYNNLFYEDASSYLANSYFVMGISAGFSSPEFTGTGGVDNILIAHNTFAGMIRVPLTVSFTGSPDHSNVTDFIIENNIFQTTSSETDILASLSNGDGDDITYGGGGGSYDVVFDYNIYYGKTDIQFDAVQMAFSTWDDTNSRNINGLTSDPSLDANYKPDSINDTVVGAGVYLDTVSTDKDGSSRGNPPTIGAYEFTQYPSASGITFSGVTIGQ
jgi:hypothetical protein